MNNSPWIILWSLALLASNSALANWLPSTSSLQSVSQLNFMNPIRNLFRGNEAEIQAMPNTYDTLCSPESEEHPTGSCVNLATCMFSGGSAAPAMADDNCGPLEGVCCTHHVRCGDTMVSRVAFWESDEYPAMSSKLGGCTLTITPSRNVCYIRAEFLDTVLTSPVADTCEGNTLTINGQVEGNSGVICGNLNQHSTFIRVNEGMAGVFRVYKDVVMHMDIQDELHKYKIKLTQIKCDQTKKSPIKIGRRHSRTIDGIEIIPDESESVSIDEFEEKTKKNGSIPEIKSLSSVLQGRVKRQATLNRHGNKKSNSDSQLKNNFSPVPLPNPANTLQLQNKQVLGQWTWLRNMVSSLPSFENILDAQDPKAAVQPLKSDTLPIGCDPKNSGLCATSNEKTSIEIVKPTSTPASYTTSPVITTKLKKPAYSSVAMYESSKDESNLKQLLGERISPAKGSNSRLTLTPGTSILNSRLSELLRSQISSLILADPTADDKKSVNNDPPTSESPPTPAPSSLEQLQQAISNSKKTLVQSNENPSGSRYSVASSEQKPGEKNSVTYTFNNTDTYIEEFGTTTAQTKNSTSNANKSDSLSVPDGNSTVIAGLNAFVNKQRLFNDSALSVGSDIEYELGVHTKNNHILRESLPEYLRRSKSMNVSDTTNNRAAVKANARGRAFYPDFQPKTPAKSFVRMKQRTQMQPHEMVSSLNDELRFLDSYSSFLSENFPEAPEVIPNLSLHDRVPQRTSSPKLGTRDNLYFPGQVFDSNVRHVKKDFLTPTREPSMLQNWLSTLSLSELEKFSAVLRRDNIYSDALITDDISIRELKQSVNEETEARKALGGGLSIPRRRPSYGNMAEDGFLVLVSPIENDGKNDNKYDSVPPRGDLEALAQHVGKLAASNFIANFRQSSGIQSAGENDSKNERQKTPGSRKEKDTSYYGYLVIKNEVGEHFFCSATLISPRHALTAASCVMRKGYETKNYEIHAVFNEDDLGDARYRTGESLFNHTNHIRVTQTVFHPMYKHGSLHFDLAVLKLEKDVNKCNPISIARPDTELMGEDITILGHGVRPTPALTFAAYERHLTYISGRYLHQAACNEFYEDSPRIGRVYQHNFIQPEMLCILSSEGVQLCEGDQGGPVVVNFDDDRKGPRLVGIASGNDNNCIGVQRRNIGEFPDVAVRLTWPIVEFIEIATAEIIFEVS